MNLEAIGPQSLVLGPGPWRATAKQKVQRCVAKGCTLECGIQGRSCDTPPEAVGWPWARAGAGLPGPGLPGGKND